MKINNFEEIIAWQKAKSLTLNIYTIFKESKGFGFKDQIQRASISIMNNIAEGFDRQNNNEFRRFLMYSKGSCGEVRSMLYIAKELNFISENIFNKLHELTIEISKMISVLHKKLKN